MNSYIQKLGNSLAFLWEHVQTKGISLAEIFHTTGNEIISNVHLSPRTSPKPIVDRNNQIMRSPTIFPLADVRSYSTISSIGLSSLAEFIHLSIEEKERRLTHAGLSLLLPQKMHPKEENFQKAWSSVAEKLPDFPPFPSENPDENLAVVVSHLPSYHPSIQHAPIVTDINEAILFEAFHVNPYQMIHLPFSSKPSEDSKISAEIIQRRINPDAFIIEDGSGNSQNLISLVDRIKTPVGAVGTDLGPWHTNIGQMLSQSLGLKNVFFSAAHALYRASPRKISRSSGQHITLALRLIPVFNEEKILAYMEKISKELQPKDFWCGSIALPEGELHEKNSEDIERIKRYSIRKIATSFGATTFVHKPDFDIDSTMVSTFNASFNEIGLRFDKESFYNVILNTFMTCDQFETLAAKFGLKFAEAPVKVDCKDNIRAVITLEKA